MIPFHLLHIAFGHNVSSKKKGMILRTVTCEHCQEKYVYQLYRTGRGNAYAFFHIRTHAVTAKSQAAASKQLRHRLQSDEDIVPCPSCGYLQASMIKKKKQPHIYTLKWGLAVIGLFTLIALIFQLAPAPNPDPRPLWTITLAAAIAWTLYLAWLLFHNPNARAHRRTRAALGPKCRALPQSELHALLNNPDAPLP
jgi:hypothetical protein